MKRWILKSKRFNNEYLTFIGGDWGPNHGTTKDIKDEDVCLFDTKKDALEYAKTCNWSEDDDLIAVAVNYIPAKVELIK